MFRKIVHTGPANHLIEISLLCLVSALQDGPLHEGFSVGILYLDPTVIRRHIYQRLRLGLGEPDTALLRVCYANGIGMVLEV